MDLLNIALRSILFIHILLLLAIKMKRQTTIVILILIAISPVWFSCSRSIIVKPNDLSFNGITLYPNHTFDIVYAEHDVGGVILNFGDYYYNEDTLVLELNKNKYLNQLTKPISFDCEEGGIYLTFKEYLSPYDKTSSVSMYWLDLSVKGISNDRDTLSIWETNSMGRETNMNQIKLKQQDLADIQKIWVEVYDTPTTDPIELPKEYKCLDITIPLINVIGAQVWSEKVMWGMDEFVIKETKRHYKVEAIQRQSEFKIKKASNRVDGREQ